jgi:hypothetical protein
MVEIAFCIGIVAFAMVAILGILPRGLRVQKENREDTVLNQDGPYILEAIRSGSQGLDDLLRCVESITVQTGGVSQTYTNGPGPLRLTTGRDIIGLLSIPKYEEIVDRGGVRFVTNRVTARIRALSGLASEKNGLTNEMAFRYLLTSEIIPFQSLPPNLSVSDPGTIIKAQHLRKNFHEIRLTLRGPLFQRGNRWEAVGKPRVYRTQVSAELARINDRQYFFRPQIYTQTR